MKEKFSWVRVYGYSLVFAAVIVAIQIVEGYFFIFAHSELSAPASTAKSQVSKEKKEGVGKKLLLGESPRLVHLLERRAKKQRLAFRKGKIAATKSDYSSSEAEARKALDFVAKIPSLRSNKWLYKHLENQSQMPWHKRKL